MKYQDYIYDIIQNVLNLTESIKNIDIGTNLQNVGMDSISFVRMIVEIENLLNIEFPDDRLTMNQAGTIKQLCEIIMEVKGELE